MATAQIAVNAVPGSNDNVPLNVSVALSNVDNTGVTTWEWALLTQPTEGVGPSASLSSTSAAAPTFTPNREGSYLIRLIVNKDLVDEASDIIVVAVRELETGNRVPAIMETTENSGSTGWAGTAVNDILRRVTRLTDGGTFVCIADVALSPGDVVHLSGLTTIAAGLPGARKLPTVNKALATSLANVDGPLGVMAGNKDGQFLAVSPGDYCRVMVIGAIPEFSLEAGGADGDPIYVSDTGTLSLTPGTYIRQIGDIANVIVDGTYDLAIAAVANSIPRGNAGGDLGGEFPNPEVLKIKGTTLLPSTEIPGNVLQLATATTAGWGPLDLANSASTTGSLTAVRGGTGQSSYTAGDLLYASSGTALSKLEIGAPGVYLRSNGFTPAWSVINFTDVAGTVPANKGGTGFSSYSAGQMLYASGASTLATVSGTSDQVLRGGATPSFGTVPTAAFAGNSVPYDALQFIGNWENTGGTTIIYPSSYNTIGVISVSVARGLIEFTIEPLDDGAEFYNAVTVSLNNQDANIYLRFVVTGPSGFSKTFLQRFKTSKSTNTNQVVLSITMPTICMYAPEAGVYTVTASGAIDTAGSNWAISNYRLIVWQG